MDSDIKLDGDRLHLEATSIHAKAADFILDSPERNKGAGGPFRRALVHDFQDGLTINWAKDYPGGVTINGVVNAPDKLNANAVKVSGDITIDRKDLKPQVFVLEPGGPHGGPRPKFTKPEYDRTPLDLGITIAELLKKVADLEARVVALERK